MFKELVNKLISEGIPFLVIPQNKENVIDITTDKAKITITSPSNAFIESLQDNDCFESFVDSQYNPLPRILPNNKPFIHTNNYDNVIDLLNEYFSM